MEKEFVPYAEALALKELGFDEPCFGAWVNNELFITENEKPKIQSLSINQCTAPLYQQAFKFFREKYELYGVVSSYFGGAVFGIEDKNNNYINKLKFKTHEEAELQCLKKLIEIAKEK